MKEQISEAAKGLRIGIADRALWFHYLLEAAERQGTDIEKVSAEALSAFGEKAAKAYGKMEHPSDFVQAMDQGIGKEAFQAETIKADEELSVLRLNYCPLVEAWKENGLSPERIKKLCYLTQYADCGRLSGTPLSLTFKSLISEGAPFCEIHVTPIKNKE